MKEWLIKYIVKQDFRRYRGKYLALKRSRKNHSEEVSLLQDEITALKTRIGELEKVTSINQEAS
ncbi:MAG: hypothetical protein AAF388_01920 [Bacteroidota bacterium]